MFERFTERARQVVVLSQQAARGLHHSHIGTEHLLIGMIDESEGLAYRVLETVGIEREPVVAAIKRITGVSEDWSDDLLRAQIPFTPRAKKVLELALREALSLGHNYIGTEHILLGLVRENEGVAARILLDFDADSEKIRNEVIRMLSGPGGRSEAGARLEPQRYTISLSEEAARWLRDEMGGRPRNEQESGEIYDLLCKTLAHDFPLTGAA
jgi:ATP-dependent Clp protease ATP-binding subunit ClpC